MGGNHRILLVHSDAAWSATLRRDLGDALVAVRSVEEAWKAIEAEPVELVVAEDGVEAGFLEELSKRTPGTPRAILLNGGDRRPWLEAAAEGHRFAAIPEQAPDLAARLLALVQVNPESAQGVPGCTVEVVAASGGPRVSGPLLRLANDSLGFRLEPGDALEAFLPGRELQEVAVRRGSLTILSGCSAEVRRLLPDENGAFEVELMLGPPPSPSPAEEVVRDPMQRASL